MKQINNILILGLTLSNAGLLIYLFGMLPFFLFVSIMLNIILVAYIVYSISEKTRLEDDLGSLYDSMEKFANHVEEVHSLEMYYGDQNLQNLIDHSKDIVNEMIDFQILYTDAEVEVESNTDGKEEETT